MKDVVAAFAINGETEFACVPSVGVVDEFAVDRGADAGGYTEGTISSIILYQCDDLKENKKGKAKQSKKGRKTHI